MKNKLCSYEEFQNEARIISDDINCKCLIKNELQVCEADFLAIQNLCEDLHEQNIFYKNGLTDPHPIIGILIMPSGATGCEKAFMFVKNLPYKMLVSITVSGVHKLLTLLVITYVNLNHLPAQKLLEMLAKKCKKRS
ncbi:unnamed protein product [Rotaria sp. Silwood2]|nr:unnamed protein product [Rotaria sp. Silwood2]CAF4064146.1 unnamed protein product [Rotaria sp. Silwood2]CAF4467270.1 unnamed protein product [Rotaria sp. Silwood2]CAF4527267.1 unnamed protein product [Rotaria sp. Silwood2]